MFTTSYHLTRLLPLRCRWTSPSFFPALLCFSQPGRAAHLCSLLTAALSVCSAACCFRCFKCYKILSRLFSPAINHASHLGAGVPCNPQLAQTFLDTVPATQLCLSEFMVPGCNVHPAAVCWTVSGAPLHSLIRLVGGLVGGLFQSVGPWSPP